jgi:hippurate hydrolase
VLSTSLLDEARRVLPQMVAVRRRIHAEPEMGLHLPRTQATIADELRALGLEPSLGRTTTSVVTTIKGARPGPVILLRADMDALPLQEDTDLDFASAVPGVMHACGHDTHVAMLLGAARLLTERQAELPGSVLLMFQPGEEGYYGARYMLDEGLLDAAGSQPSGALAIHITTMFEAGTIHFRRGPQMAATDTIRITVRGRGGHASAPHRAADPIPVAAEIILALQVLVTRTVDAFDPAVITIANVASGTTTNVIPETAFMQGTMRTVSEGTREALRGRVRELAESVARAYGCTADVELEPGYPVTINDPGFADFIAHVGRDVVGADAIHEMPAPIMGAEDFSYVLQRVPGAMAFLGGRPLDVDPATAPQNHSNRVVFDEPSMAVGAALYAAVALRHLGAG